VTAITMTEMSFGLPSDGTGRLAQHGGHRRWSTYL